MNSYTKDLRVVLPPDEPGKPTGLALMREPFPAHLISKLPKPTKKQTDDVRKDFTKGIRCKICGQWHHKDVVHLDYVGHAALTDRLLDCDPHWNWEAVKVDEFGQPVFDNFGGMWIRLTVCGVTRLGYGHPDGKDGGNAIKETIGDALRNAAMRFGAALDLWHKGDLHADDDAEPPAVDAAKTVTPDQYIKLRDTAEQAGVDEAKICDTYGASSLQQFPADMFGKAMTKLNATIKAQQAEKPDDLGGDDIPEFEQEGVQA